MYKNYQTISAFNEISWHNFVQGRSNSIRTEIESNTKTYILGVDEAEYKNYLFNKYYLHPLEIDPNSETVYEPEISRKWIDDEMWGRRYQIEVYSFTVRYKFSGSGLLFAVRPDSRIVTSYPIHSSDTDSTIAFDFDIYNREEKDFEKTKSRCYTEAFANIDNINKNAEEWNKSLKDLVSSLFDSIKAKYLDENKFFEAIKVKVNKNTESIFTAPTVKRKIIPKPIPNSKKEFSSEPTMHQEMYEDILRIIYDGGKSMEKKPALYQNKDEEGLRDQFLFILETRYEGITATGETFNRSGKTDILLKYAKDSSNLFVAECRFWHGATEFHEAIGQLFDRYLTWRDSKVALILFVRNKEFTRVIESIKSEAVKHPYCVEEIGARGETSFSYHFHLPQDIEKKVYLEIMAFHYDK